MKRVLIVSKYFHPFESGSEKTTRYIIDYLTERGYKTTLFCARGGREKLNPSAEFFSLEGNPLYLFLSSRKASKAAADVFFGFFIMLFIILRERPESINIHYTQAMGLPAVLLAKLFSIKSIVLWPTSSLYHSKKSDGKISFIIDKTYSYLADAFLAKGMPSGQMRKYLDRKSVV